jgi:hypothetical protein
VISQLSYKYLKLQIPTHKVLENLWQMLPPECLNNTVMLCNTWKALLENIDQLILLHH